MEFSLIIKIVVTIRGMALYAGFFLRQTHWGDFVRQKKMLLAGAVTDLTTDCLAITLEGEKIE